MGARLKPGPKPREKDERYLQAAIMDAISRRAHDHRQKVRRDMQDYWANHKRLGEKVTAARAAGMSYGYYVALVVEKRGRLNWKEKCTKNEIISTVRRGRKEKIYAFYQGEEMVTSGTLQEIADETGLTVATLRFYCTPAYKRRVKGNNHREVFALEE